MLRDPVTSPPNGSSGLAGGSLDNAAAPVQQLEIVDDGGIGGVELVCPLQFATRLRQIAAQHVRIALVVQDSNGFAGQSYRLRVSLIGKVEAPQAVVAGGK